MFPLRVLRMLYFALFLLSRCVKQHQFDIFFIRRNRQAIQFIVHKRIVTTQGLSTG